MKTKTSSLETSFSQMGRTGDTRSVLRWLLILAPIPKKKKGGGKQILGTKNEKRSGFLPAKKNKKKTQQLFCLCGGTRWCRGVCWNVRNIRCHRTDSFSWEVHGYFSSSVPEFILHDLHQQSFMATDCVTDCLPCSPDLPPAEEQAQTMWIDDWWAV